MALRIPAAFVYTTVTPDLVPLSSLPGMWPAAPTMNSGSRGI